MSDPGEEVENTGEDAFESDDEIREERENMIHPPPTSELNGNKKAVFVGIKYKGTTESTLLNGGIYTAENVAEFVFEKFGFSHENSMTLTDKEDQDEDHMPTRENILRAMDWLVEGAQEGDSLLFFFSGHGGQLQDTSGDESDKMDEYIVPVDTVKADMSTRITDDEANDHLVKPVPEGVRLTILMDTCHSGTLFDLPFMYTYDDHAHLLVGSDAKRRTLLNAVNSAGQNDVEGDTKGTLAALAGGLKIGKMVRSHKHGESSQGDVIMLSGCRDDQTSKYKKMDNEWQGLMSQALVKVYRAFEESEGSAPSYIKMLEHVRAEVQQYDQIPQMATGRLMNMDSPFVM